MTQPPHSYDTKLKTTNRLPPNRKFSYLCKVVGSLPYWHQTLILNNVSLNYLISDTRGIAQQSKDEIQPKQTINFIFYNS